VRASGITDQTLAPHETRASSAIVNALAQPAFQETGDDVHGVGTGDLTLTQRRPCVVVCQRANHRDLVLPEL
jgi:hypothetical protein